MPAKGSPCQIGRLTSWYWSLTQPRILHKQSSAEREARYPQIDSLLVPEELSRVSRVRFNLVYDGPALKESEMAASDLSAALLATDSLFRPQTWY